ncbi:MAG: thioredoxin family protein [Armatimonadia bacterium]
MRIEVLGMGCTKCKKLAELTAQAVQELGVEAEIVKVEEVKEIMKYNVLSTPGLVVEGELKAAGRLPSLDEVKGFIQQAQGG